MIFCERRRGMSEGISNRLGILGRHLGSMILRPRIVLIAIALGGAILLLSQPASRGFAQSTTILIQPSAPDVNVDDTVTVDIRIEDVTDLYGVDVRLSFDPTLLKVQDADGNPANGIQIQEGSFPAPDFRVKNEADNDAGTIWYAVSQQNPTGPISGSGVAASVTFRGLAEGTSSVAFTYQKIVEIDGERIPATTQDGQITVIAEAWPSGLFGDFNGDCEVDIDDIMEVANRWRTSCDNPDPDDNDETPNYDAFYDVNKDCVINIVDIMLIAAHWGDTCPE
jgi:hypothetical protein